MKFSHNKNSRFEEAVDWLRSAERIVVFSGAGISSSSGITTFRDEGGFWKQFPPEQFANWKGLLQTAALQPGMFADFLVAILEPVANSRPNAAHQAITELEKFTSVDVITQNIDRLHQFAGSQSVYEIHGSLFEVVSYPSGEITRELTCDDLLSIVSDLKTAKQQLWSAPKLLKAIKPLMSADWNGFHRPNLVLFGDQLAEPAWSDTQQCLQKCELFISVGTSLSVHPAANLPTLAKECGAKVIVVDPNVVGGDLWLPETAETILPKLVLAAFNDKDETNE